MNNPDEILDRAFAIYEEFGPDRLINRRQRLAVELDLQSPEELDYVLDKMEKISQTVWSIAKQGGEIKLGKEKVLEHLLSEHPYLESEGLRKALFLVNYFAWHDGFDR